MGFATLAMSPWELVGAAVAFYALYRIYLELTVGAARRRMIKQHGCKPVRVHPHKDPIFGLDIVLETIGRMKEGTVLAGIQRRYRNNGTTFTSNFFGRWIVSTVEPQNIKTLLALKFKDFGLAPLRSPFIPLLGRGIFTTDGAEWEHSRAMLRPNFVRSQVGDLDTFETHINNLIKNIPTDGSTVDLQELFFDLTLDSATEFLFGESAGSLNSADRRSEESFGEAFTYCTTRLGNSARAGLRRLLPDKRHQRSLKIVHEFVDRYVQSALEYHRAYPSEKTGEREGRYVFLRELAKQTEDPVTLRAEALNILLAGRDTTASLLSEVWLTLSRRPDVWAKLHKEVDALEGKRPTFEEIKDMRYLRYVLNEALRLYPVVPGNARAALRDTVLPLGGGPDGQSPVFVKKGTLVGYNTFTLHRREDLFGPDAAEFRPERWETLRPGWEFLPFNGGPRICLGQQFALTEASYTTIRLMQEFKTIESRDDRPWKESLTLTCTSGVGAHVALGR